MEGTWWMWALKQILNVDQGDNIECLLDLKTLRLQYV